jgi:hypothetical protein
LNKCWILLVARGLEMWLPPEIYLSKSFAETESERWRAILHIAASPPPLTARSKSLHLVLGAFPDPWRACPMWIGLTWSETSYPEMKTQLLAADSGEAAAWLNRRTPKSVQAKEPGQHVFERRGIGTAVGVFRVKRVVGF